jgi:hypothetical protein
MILGETAGVGRFRSKDAYARFTGTCGCQKVGRGC